MNKKTKKLKSTSKEKKCKVCKRTVEKSQKLYCTDCSIFVKKAGKIIRDSKPKEDKDKGKSEESNSSVKLRKPVEFDLSNQDNNKLLFAKEMRKSWDDTKPYHLCPYTLLPMYLENPITEKEAKIDEEKKRKRNIFKYLVFSPDRICSEKNYEPDNIKVCTYLGNVMKNDLKVDTFDSVLIEMIKDKVSIKEDKTLVKMMLLVFGDFYNKVDLSKEELEEHSKEIDKIKEIIDQKKESFN